MGRLLAQLFEITALFDMRLRPELVLLQKTMVTVEGVARRIDPDHDIWAAAEPVVAPLDRPRALARRRASRDLAEEARAGAAGRRPLRRPDEPTPPAPCGRHPRAPPQRPLDVRPRRRDVGVGFAAAAWWLSR